MAMIIDGPHFDINWNFGKELRIIRNYCSSSVRLTNVNGHQIVFESEHLASEGVKDRLRTWFKFNNYGDGYVVRSTEPYHSERASNMVFEGRYTKSKTLMMQTAFKLVMDDQKRIAPKLFKIKFSTKLRVWFRHYTRWFR